MTVAFCKAVQGRKHRIHQWIDTAAMTVKYGIQANVERGLWAHVVEGNSPLLFDDERLAKNRARELSRPAKEVA
jgi:predicted metalloprotease